AVKLRKTYNFLIYSSRENRMDSSKVPLGEPSGPFLNYCDPGEIAAFALAINDDNPLYRDGRAVPPTYPVVPVFEAMRSLGQLPPEAMAGGRGGGHGEHDLYIRRPITPGMALHTTADRYAVVVSKAGMNVFTRLMSVDDDGQLVIEQYWSSIMVGEATGGNQGPDMPDHTFLEAARSRKVGTMSLPTTDDQTFRYAGASGDRSTIHVSDQAAIQSGRPRKFNQGALSLGIASRALVALAAGGDPSRITRVAVRFSRSAYPGDDIDVSVYDAGSTAEGQHAYAFETASLGNTVLKNGWVEVTPAT
ncbi:MAG TPA: MaoC/PaaZ C-terminal domain-containing protein, partial [Streptosporangiaceae bacterium]|nr:MaoC/PaaZ C-terminal domain-containing protein [Streptosporangiaceae bacterium]